MYLQLSQPRKSTHAGTAAEDNSCHRLRLLERHFVLRFGFFDWLSRATRSEALEEVMELDPFLTSEPLPRHFLHGLYEPSRSPRTDLVDAVSQRSFSQRQKAILKSHHALSGPTCTRHPGHEQVLLLLPGLFIHPPSWSLELYPWNPTVTKKDRELHILLSRSSLSQSIGLANSFPSQCQA